MNKRPDLGARVRVLGNTRILNVAGKCGYIADHHPDGIAFVVRLEVDGAPIVCDPINVEPAPTGETNG